MMGWDDVGRKFDISHSFLSFFLMAGLCCGFVICTLPADSLNSHSLVVVTLAQYR